MATEIPDIRNLEKWEDAFHYPIPTTRAIEKRLSASLNENHDKLRTLVGASYRDLLSTARTIIDIDQRLHDVETLLRNTGQRTDSRHLERLRNNYANFNSHALSKGQDRYAFTSQLFTLQKTLTVISNTVRSRGSVLICTKLLILARLLHKVLTQRTDAPPLVEELGSKLGNLRQKLLRLLDKKLSQHGFEIDELVEGLTAFCLATSSSPSNALTHVLGLRAKAIQKPRQGAHQNVKDCIEMRLALFHATIRQARNVFPDLLGASLRTMGSRAVLDDDKIKKIEELKLDVHARWFGDDIQNYTPWTRYDELQRSAAHEQIQTWTKDSLVYLAESIREDLGTENDVRNIVGTRNAILQTWLSTRASVRGVSAQEALQKFRLPFAQRCSELVDSVTLDMMESLKASTIAKLENWDEDDISKTLPSLWDPSISSEDLADGADSFRQTILDRRTGRTAGVGSVVSECDRYTQQLTDMYAAFKSMRDVRWDDDYDEDAEEDESGDDDRKTLESSNTHDVLSRKDPEALLRNLSESVIKATQSLETEISSAINIHRPTTSTASSPGVFMLRSLCVLRQSLPKLLAALNSPNSKALFSRQEVSALHIDLAHSTIEGNALIGLMTNLLSRPLHIRVLWDGNPPLPLQLSPTMFKFFRNTCQRMQSVGVDVWNPDAVQELKKTLGKTIVEAVHEAVEKMAEKEERSDGPTKQGNDDEPNAEDGHQDETNTTSVAEDTNSSSEPTDTTPSMTQDHFIQLLFDIMYTQHALMPMGLPTSSPGLPIYSQHEAHSTFTPLVELLMQRAELNKAEDEPVRARLQKNVREYWRRTYLLFGLLCNG